MAGIEKEQVWKNKETEDLVLILRARKEHIFFQLNGFIRFLTPKEFIDGFTKVEGEK